MTAGELGSVDGHLLDEWGQVAVRSALEAHGPELHAVEEGGVGLAAVGADLECFGGPLFGLVGVPGDLRSHGTRAAVHPVQRSAGRAARRATRMMSKQRSISSMSRARAAVLARRRAAQNSRTGSPSRSARTRASADQSNDCWSSAGTASGNQTSVEDSHDGGVVAGGLAMAMASSASAWRRSRGLP